MITHRDIPSERFYPEAGLLLIKPRELPKGEVKHGELIIEMEQNQSVVDRPTFGEVIAVGEDVDSSYINSNVIWVEHDGMDLELQDGGFIVIKLKSLLGKVK
jgi:hypothetical protein